MEMPGLKWTNFTFVKYNDAKHYGTYVLVFLKKKSHIFIR